MTDPNHDQPARRAQDTIPVGGSLRTLMAQDRMHARLVVVAGVFCILFSAIGLKLTLATIIRPMPPQQQQIAPQVPPIPKSDPKGMIAGDIALPQVHRASIIDRSGQVLAMSLPVAQVYANPQEMIDATDAAHKLKSALPTLNEEETKRRLSLNKQFVYLARDISPAQELAINNLGIPGIYFEPGERRRYPMGRVAAQILGGVDIDDHGVAGVERFFDKRLDSDRAPLRLSVDVRVQNVVHDELQSAMDTFQAIGACAIVMDVHTGEIITMVSLPDYDANDFGRASPDSRFNRAVTGMYEPGSTFKLQTVAMALQEGVAHIWDSFSSTPIKIGRFTISDMKADHFAPWLSLPEVMAYSSNPAAAHIALDAGAARQQDWLRNMGFFSRVPVELPEAGRPIIPSVHNWGVSTTMTVAFGHGVAEPPLSIVRGTAATANGGFLLRPTLVAAEASHDGTTPDAPDAAPGMPADAERLISAANSDILRKILRLDVAKGTGQKAESPGYYVGGKTGTAEKIGPHGGYLKHVNVSAFTGIFPMNAPRYAIYVMLDSPKPTAQTHGWTTAGWNAAPTASHMITRIAPMLGLFPDTQHTAAIEASLAIPMKPAVPRGYRALGPGYDPGTAHLHEHEREATGRHAHTSRGTADTAQVPARNLHARNDVDSLPAPHLRNRG
ncbi:peptidoglycan D,D-transpeptidase FtsI family protein [Komagataeibacter oboediens]|uniref:Penicillin-binding protein 2 n=1 Tax=Komagataeibacter oboediens TaxID=65958 RepID=A0ABS5SPH5_9PROT|nr:penicillin-binding protein 2 [Komagataeibacter oboediens]MBL7233499.1 penicillin-binding protein 2 [Komagataeibacter oboediens]MBT0675667.1 penicillin-binding protein 2 [Komagataeibacter oboediens]MBT0678326.1 penicillin-binding protein 2 [Komagataeibacter oboediens]MBV1825042.1 penicillin-binding protein 2 [Komagataeibacter oboediens]